MRPVSEREGKAVSRGAVLRIVPIFRLFGVRITTLQKETKRQNEVVVSSTLLRTFVILCVPLVPD